MNQHQFERLLELRRECRVLHSDNRELRQYKDLVTGGTDGAFPEEGKERTSLEWAERIVEEHENTRTQGGME